MELVFLIVLSCSSALMDDCIAWAPHSWRGANALEECRAFIPVYKATERAPTPFNRIYCEAE